MKTNQAEYKTDIARLAEAMARRDAELARRDTELARRDTELAKNAQDNQRWTVGFGIAQIVLMLSVLGAGFAFLGILISSP